MPKKIKGKIASVDLEAYTKILHFFFAYPTNAFSLSDISSTLSIHKQTASKIIKQFQKEEFLDIETIGNLWRITCNQKHYYNIVKKIPYNIQLIYESGIVAHIREQIPQAKCIILFGSYRKGDDTVGSDIDIAVEVLDDKDVQIMQLGVVTHLGYRKNVVVNLYIFSRNHINLNLFNNIANGIVLEGFLEVRP
ncbi:MAG: nucleotidyltransferase domain-containing protein [Candidatus Woesearchaeota archaeon]